MTHFCLLENNRDKLSGTYASFSKQKLGRCSAMLTKTPNISKNRMVLLFFSREFPSTNIKFNIESSGVLENSSNMHINSSSLAAASKINLSKSLTYKIKVSKKGLIIISQIYIKLIGTVFMDYQ